MTTVIEGRIGPAVNMVDRDTLEGQQAMVTGATSGIGSAVARQLRSRAKKTAFADPTPTRAGRDIAARPGRSSTGEKADWD
jgi:NAD(P)-dependent dehydrogenase (short-subunit alcohol dehydrogenase family)